MYSIDYDGAILYDPRDESRDIRDASARISVASSGDLSTGEMKFTIQADHPEFNRLKLMTGIMELKQDDVPVFRGRIARDTMDMDLSHVIEVESVFTCLNDSAIPPFDFPADHSNVSAYQTAAASGNVVEYFLNWILTQHNAQVSNEQKLYCGTVTVTDPNNYISRSQEDYATTLDVIKGKLLDLLGGYMVLRYTSSGTYIDYLATFTAVNSQAVEYASNLTNFEREIDSTEIFNEILPIGDEGLTIASLDDGQISTDLYKTGVTIYSASGRARFRHKIIKIVEWSDVTVAANLKTKAAAELAAHNGGAASESISCTAIDLSYAEGTDVEAFRVGRMTPVKSAPHGLDASYPLTEISIPDLKRPGSTEITLGNVTVTLSATVHR